MISYGKDYGDNGYMNYARGDENLELCQFYHKSYTVLVTYRRGKTRQPTTVKVGPGTP